jgi:hypothetical protein
MPKFFEPDLSEARDSPLPETRQVGSFAVRIGWT